MVKILEKCREMVIEWGTQVDTYFQEKWDLKADIKQLDEWIEELKVREHIDSALPDDWVETKVDMTQITGGKLQDFINVLDDAIRYLENHHYNTAKLIESTQKILGTYDKKE